MTIITLVKPKSNFQCFNSGRIFSLQATGNRTQAEGQISRARKKEWQWKSRPESLKQVFAFFCAAGRFSSGASFSSLLLNWRRTSSSILLGSSGDWKVIPPDYSTAEPMTTDWTSLTLESRCDLFCRGRICMIFSLTGTLQMVLPFTKYHYIVSSLLSYASLLYRGQRRYTP